MVSEIEVASVAYRVARQTIFSGVDLTVERGESVAIMGRSGVGKSTLLSLALGLLKPTEGEVRVAGEDMGRLSAKSLAAHRARHIGMVFQHGELIDELSPAENVVLPLLWSGEPDDAMERANGLLERVGVSTGDTDAAGLSGGERQRVAVARALIARPAVLLADEPTGSLDEASAAVVSDLLFDLPRTDACALLVVTHDSRVAARADRVMQLSGDGLQSAA